MHFFSDTHIQDLKKYLMVKKNPGKNEKKLWKKVEKYSPVLSKIPGILCICVGNSLAMNTAHKDSDIDLFIITQKNRIWTARILSTVLLTILGQRKTATQHAGKFCLSFFITENAMHLENIAIKDDIYLSYWIQTLKPIVDKDNTFKRFIEKNKSPLSNNGFQEHETGLLKKKGPGNLFESLLKSIFLPRTKKSFQKLGKPFGVIISDDILKFHDKDKRKEIRKAIIFFSKQI